MLSLAQNLTGGSLAVGSVANHQLQLQQLTIVRGSTPVCHDLTISACSGQIVYLSGINGCGKSTLIAVMAGLLAPTKGKVIFDQFNINTEPDRYASLMACMGHRHGIKPMLTVSETLKLSLSACSVSDDACDDAMEQLNLRQLADEYVAVLSEGQKKRLALALVYLADRPLWLLDEPFVALDKHTVPLVTRLLARHCDAGGMVVLSSHYDAAVLPSVDTHAIVLPYQVAKLSEQTEEWLI